jgi:ferrous iron transport protein B
MLPPMAIFFPLFTLLEDSGYLPRVAYNLDKPFSKCSACGKQGITMCMGLGCNAAAIVGCRIIDSKRERLIAMLTNVFVPCNGRFPMIISLAAAFFVGSSGIFGSFFSAASLTAVILFGVLMTFLTSKLLSATILKGEPSSFTLELPPYRRPQFGKVIVRSLLDRTVFVLGRAAAVAAPAGLLIWLLANITIGDTTILGYVTSFLDPFARFIGMDGVILTAFILGLPANEIVIPLMIMMYTAQGSLSEIEPAQMASLFTANGWTWVTALCVILFCLMHSPCSTSLLTVKKEAGGWRWAALAFAVPTAAGIVVCALVAAVGRMFGV